MIATVRAVEPLYRDHRGDVLSYVTKLVANCTDAEDITSETFARALQRINTGRVEDINMRGWLCTIALRIVMDRAKSSQYRLETATDDFRDIAASVSGPEQVALDHATTAELHRHIDQLNSPRQKKSIQLRFLTELSVTDTARTLSCATGTVKALQHRAIQQLRASLTERPTTPALTVPRLRVMRRPLQPVIDPGQCRWPAGCTNPGGRESGYCHNHYCKLYSVRKLRSGLVDPTPTRARITAHINRGGTVTDLARAARVAHSNIINIIHGTAPRIRVRVADRILAVPVRPSNVGCERRVHALTAIGHTIPTIADAARVRSDRLYKAHQQCRYVTDLARALTVAFDRLSGRPGTSRKTVMLARGKQHASPLAWHGIDIDDPAAAPNIGPDIAATTADRVAETLRLIRFGETKRDACTQAGIKIDTFDTHQFRARRKVEA